MTKSNLQIQCNPIQNPATFFSELAINNIKINMEVQTIRGTAILRTTITTIKTTRKSR